LAGQRYVDGSPKGRELRGGKGGRENLIPRALSGPKRKHGDEKKGWVRSGDGENGIERKITGGEEDHRESSLLSL